MGDDKTSYSGFYVLADAKAYGVANRLCFRNSARLQEQRRRNNNVTNPKGPRTQITGSQGPNNILLIVFWP